MYTRFLFTKAVYEPLYSSNNTLSHSLQVKLPVDPLDMIKKY
jgi:hypothetical protein